MTKIVSFLRTVLSGGLLATVALAAASYQAGKAREVSRTAMRLGLEDVANRVRLTAQNLRSFREFSDDVVTAKARAFAQMLVDRPSLLKDQSELDACARTLGVDELHVTDGRGVFVAGVPNVYIGRNLAESAQSSAFLPLLTNSVLEFVQEPMPKGIVTGGTYDRKMFQYAGVGRRDVPGLVQVGYQADRIAEAMKLADIEAIASTSRVGPGGTVSIVPAAGLPPPVETVVGVRGADGSPQAQLEADCESYRIRVTAPDASSWLAEPDRFQALLVCALVLLLLLVLTLPGGRRVLRQDAAALRTAFGGSAGAEGSFRRAFSGPVTLVCAAALLLAVGVAWLVLSRSAAATAERQLRSAEADMRNAVDGCVDNFLFYLGSAIVGHYRRPEAMSVEMVQDLMKRYGLDEFNVVDARGIVLAGALADVGFDMSSNTNSAKFNCLLAGAKTYSQPFRAPIENPEGSKRKYAGIAFPWPVRGYIQIGFDESRLRHGVDYWFERAADDVHIGATGYFIIADVETGKVLSCGRKGGGTMIRSGVTLASIGFDVSIAPKSADEVFTAHLFGEDCLCLTEVRGFHRIVSAIPLREVKGGALRIVLLTAAVLLAVFVIVVFFMTKLSNLVLSRKGYIEKEHGRQERDRAMARTIQSSSLPVVFPDDPAFRIFAEMDTAREVGGDFYDFYRVPSGKILFLIADVSGKGIPAAMFMMKAKAIIKACVFAADDFAAAVSEANDRLVQGNAAEMFVTAWFGLLDPATGEVSYVNAGHNPPLVKRADGSVEWIRGRRSLVLAAMAGVKYQVERLTLGPGESLLLYTDGVTEAANAAGELFGEARLEACLRAAGPESVTEIRRDVAAFAAGAEQSDDITMLALDFKARPDAYTEPNP